MGITHSMIVMLQSRGVSYTDQALFTLAVYPFSCKFLSRFTSQLHNVSFYS